MSSLPLPVHSGLFHGHEPLWLLGVGTVTTITLATFGACGYLARKIRFYGRESAESYSTGYDLGLRDGCRKVVKLRAVMSTAE